MTTTLCDERHCPTYLVDVFYVHGNNKYLVARSRNQILVENVPFLNIDITIPVRGTRSHYILTSRMDSTLERYRTTAKISSLDPALVSITVHKTLQGIR